MTTEDIQAAVKEIEERCGKATPGGGDMTQREYYTYLIHKSTTYNWEDYRIDEAQVTLEIVFHILELPTTEETCS